MPARRLLAAYDGLLTRHRLATTSISGAILSGAGDAVVQQSAAASGTAVDVDRLVAFTTFGALLTGPINWVWLSKLERAVGHIAPGGGVRAVVAKVVLQSIIMQPFIYLPSFYATNALVRKWSVSETVEHVRGAYLPTLSKVWLFWTPSVVFAFGWLPVRQQAVFFAGIGFCWNCVLSFCAGEGPQRLRALPRRLSASRQGVGE